MADAAKCEKGLEGTKRVDCPNVKETHSDMSGERYRCEKCGYSYYLDYEEMR